MSKRALLILLFHFTTTLQAQIFSELHLKLYDNTPFTLTIDQKKYPTASNNFVLRLLPGKHYLSVIRSTIPNYSSKDTFNIATFSGVITIPYNVSIYAHIDPSHMFSVFKVVPYSPENNTATERNFDPGLYYPNKPASTTPDQYNLLNEESYKKLKEILDKTNASKTKLEILKEAVTYNPVRSIQVAELMKYMDFDSERIEFAKYAYYFTQDKENYFLINGSFIFKGSIKEISDYIYKYSYK